jgi:alcohol dehydrogenase
VTDPLTEDLASDDLASDDLTHLLADHVTSGAGSVTHLPALVRELGASRVLLVCGRRSFEASGAAAVLPELERVAVVQRWSDFVPNTDADDLGRGLEIAERFAPDLVLGVGGGSAMDMAKLLGAYLGHVSGAAVVDAIRAGGSVDTRPHHLVLVPTTSGSGAETTRFAVVYTGHDKHSIAGPAMLPDRIVLDPALTLSGSAYQRATSGIDAVCQAIESLWAVGATEGSRADARAALRLLLVHLERFVTSPDLPSATGTSLGAHLAGRAIDVSRTTAAHALSYGLTKRHGVSHGHAVAVSLGPFIEAHAAATPDRLQAGVDPATHDAAVADVLTALDAADGPAARRAFVDLVERLGLEPRPSQLGVDSDDEVAALVRTVNVERLGNDPVRFDADGLTAVLRSAG